MTLANKEIPDELLEIEKESLKWLERNYNPKASDAFSSKVLDAFVKYKKDDNPELLRLEVRCWKPYFECIFCKTKPTSMLPSIYVSELSYFLLILHKNQQVQYLVNDLQGGNFLACLCTSMAVLADDFAYHQRFNFVDEILKSWSGADQQFETGYSLEKIVNALYENHVWELYGETSQAKDLPRQLYAMNLPLKTMFNPSLSGKSPPDVSLPGDILTP